MKEIKGVDLAPKDGQALCLSCGRKSDRGFDAIRHQMWCVFYGRKK